MTTFEPPHGYDDAYPTCAETYATLRLYHMTHDPLEVERELGITASDKHSAGEWVTSPVGRRSPASWFLESKGHVASRDLRPHLDWILGHLGDKEPPLSVLRDLGWHTGIDCFWASASGHGGPSITPAEMAELGRLGLPVTFDIYFSNVPEG